MRNPSLTLPFLALLRVAAATASANYTAAALLSSNTIKLGAWQAALLVSTLATAEKLDLITGTDVTNFTALHMLDSSTNPYTY